MKKVLITSTILLFVLFCVSCENAYNPTEPTTTQHSSLAKQANPDDIGISAKKGGQDKVEICHRKGNGDYITIMVDASAVPAHMAHGDFDPSLPIVQGDLELLKLPVDDRNGREATFEVYMSCDGTISGFLHWEQTSGGTLYTHDIDVDSFTDYGGYVEFSGISFSSPPPGGGRTGDRLIITVDDDPQAYSNNWEDESIWNYGIASGVVIIN